jgi:DHA1 family multidrug resistance protein-like MFS transporter
LHSNDPEFFNALFGVTDPLEITQISSLYDAIYYFAFLVGLVLGPISDNKGKRKIFISIGALMFIIFSALLITSPGVVFLLIYRLFQGVSHIIVWQSLMVLVYDFSQKSNLAKSLSIYTIFMGLAMGLGTMFGGILADIGVFVPMLVSIISYLLVLGGATFFLHDPEQHYVRPTIKENIFLLKSNPQIIVPSMFNFVDRLHMGFLITMVPLYLTFVIPVSPGMRGMIFGLSAIPMIILSYPVGKKSDAKWGRFKPLIYGSIIYGVLLSITGFVSQFSVVIFIIILLLQGCAQGFTTAPNNSLLGDLVNPESKATAVGVFNFFGNVGIMLGPIFALFFGVNYNMAFLIAGIIELVSLAINYVLAKKMKFVDI